MKTYWLYIVMLYNKIVKKSWVSGPVNTAGCAHTKLTWKAWFDSKARRLRVLTLDSLVNIFDQGNANNRIASVESSQESLCYEYRLKTVALVRAYVKWHRQKTKLLSNYITRLVRTYVKWHRQKTMVVRIPVITIGSRVTTY